VQAFNLERFSLAPLHYFVQFVSQILFKLIVALNISTEGNADLFLF